MPPAPDGFRPLDGIKVVDLSRILAGPYCTQHLGEMGADVVKVEPPGHGDDTRGWGPPFVGDEAVYYLAANRNKRGIVLDLKSDRGRDALRRLVADADVLVENFRPGTLEKWGIGYAALSAVNPRLIHVSITGFGQTGPYRDRAGYDLVAQALGGVMSLTGEPGGAPAKVGLPVADLNAGTWAIIGVLMALQARHTTGRGQYLDVSLLDSQLAWHIYAAGAVFYDAPRPRRMGSAHPSIVPYQAYPVSDGWLIIAVGSEKLWHAFCGVLGLDIAADPRFSSNAARAPGSVERAAGAGAPDPRGGGLAEGVRRGGHPGGPDQRARRRLRGPLDSRTRPGGAAAAPDGGHVRGQRVPREGVGHPRAADVRTADVGPAHRGGAGGAGLFGGGDRGVPGVRGQPVPGGVVVAGCGAVPATSSRRTVHDGVFASIASPW